MDNTLIFAYMTAAQLLVALVLLLFWRDLKKDRRSFQQASKKTYRELEAITVAATADAQELLKQTTQRLLELQEEQVLKLGDATATQITEHSKYLSALLEKESQTSLKSQKALTETTQAALQKHSESLQLAAAEEVAQFTAQQRQKAQEQIEKVSAEVLYKYFAEEVDSRTHHKLVTKLLNEQLGEKPA